MDNGEKLDKILEWLDGFKTEYATDKERNRAHREDKRMHNTNGVSFWTPKLIMSLIIGFGAIGTLIGKAFGII